MANYPTGVEPNGGNLRVWFTYQGQRRRESLGVPDTAKNRKLAGELRANIVYQIKTGNFDYRSSFPSSPMFRGDECLDQVFTVSDIAKKWLNLKQMEIAQSSYRSYRRRVSNTIEMLGSDKPVKSIKAEDILTLRLELLTGMQLPGRNYVRTKKGRAVSTVNGCMTDLFSILDFAFQNGYILKNPMSNISPLRKERKKPDPLTKEEYPRVISSCNSRQIANLWSLAILTGLRHGEICALAWEDIDLTAGKLMVRRNLAGVKDEESGDNLFTLPKTQSSTNRTVSLIAPAIAVLRDQMELTRLTPQILVKVETREYRVTEEHECTFVFNPSVNANSGKPGAYYAVASLRQTWNAALKKAGVRSRKAYQSRHTYACWSLTAGANPNFVASQMGHADAQMVYQVYGTWMLENNAEQINMLNQKMNDLALHMPYRKAAI